MVYIEPLDMAEADANAADAPTVAVQQCGHTAPPMTPEHKALVAELRGPIAISGERRDQAAAAIEALSAQCAQPQAGEAQPANPAQVTELIADLEQAVIDFENASSATYNRSKAELVKARAALSAQCAQPANPAQVTDAMVEAACAAWNETYEAEIQIGSSVYTDNKEAAMRAALTAVIGAGGQALAASGESSR